VLHIPDVGLRLEPGQRATVATLSPQVEQLLAIRALVLEPPESAPMPAPAPSPAPSATPAPSPAPTAVPAATRRIPAAHRNAATVLPPQLLARVQRVVTGYVTIPAPTTTADRRRQRLERLHRQGATPGKIAAALRVSHRHVTRLLRSLAEPGAASSPAPHPLPARLLTQVQRYVTGRLYVPQAAPATVGRRQQMERAFQAGEPTGDIAGRLQCSTRQVRRERARWRAAQAGAEGATTLSAP
jgi:hypothetical protein